MNRNLKGIIVETDSRVLTKLLQDDNLGNHVLCNVITDCKSTLQSLGSEVMHIFRQANRYAGALANLYLAQDDIFLFSFVPNCLQHLVLDDAMGKKFPRIMSFV
ncbi:hypothetical protein RHGRI_026737 [Rhododendron griersonianum]|uniref:RNase H type-1 domain-containing protein n=1 Tax=Rhododendron griersonianum TaxID=479676 RepID=A0AAV6IW60_9ERIC|nr:hypothetical protein RHGRI_026737 [Rhododendron griersonianum]